ncbi:MAG: tetratricopeptide repeat protein [Bacteroidales bacterium]|nr:tetratricopeptide repeat protein [Bacteroidales bacterium]MCF8389268.1 tetratricopeptide repeat protein [Bacteroidales bacterium]
MSDSLSLYLLIDEAEQLSKEGRGYESQKKAEEALQVAMKTAYAQAEPTILEIMANNYFAEDNFAQALPYYLRSAGAFEYLSEQAKLKLIYSRIAICYNREGLFDKEAAYYKKALALLGKDDPQRRQFMYEKIGIASLMSHEVDTAILYFKKLNSSLGESGKDNSPALIYLIQSFRSIPDYDSCVHYSKQLLENSKEGENFSEISAIQNNIAYYLTLNGNFEEASEFYIKAYNNATMAGTDLRGQVLMLANTGICFQNMGNLEKAKDLLRKAINNLKETEYSAEKSRIENIVALIYFNEGDLYNAGVFSKNSITSAENANDPYLLRDSYHTYSLILKAGNDPENALEYYESYLNIRDSIEMSKKMHEQAQSAKRALLEKSENDLQLRIKEEKVKELAIEQLNLKLEKEEQARNLLQNESDLQLLEQEKLRQSLVISQQKNLVEKRERENMILEQEQKITHMQLAQEEQKQKELTQENKNLEQQQRLAELEAERQETAKKALKWIIGLMLIVAILILWSLIVTRKKNLLLAKRKVEIEEKNVFLEQQNEEIISQRDEIEAQRNLVFDQKEEIEEYNNELMKSIEYAKRIQAASFSDLTILDDKIAEHSLLFRPRDIVSGDFYWVGHLEGRTLIVVADSTGHGVPGAFMSILGMSLLKEIILKEYLTHPGVILRRLRKEIINALGQKGISGEQRDGMDMALISINHEEQTIEYAGAYNSLYLVRKSDLEAPAIDIMRVFETEKNRNYKLYDIPADKMPIAHFDRMDKFVTHNFPIYKGDIFYLFSDGYADQFGGSKGKKFMYKPFKRLILNNADKSLKMQNEIMTKTLDEWMEGYEQVDDICVFGIRI